VSPFVTSGKLIFGIAAKTVRVKKIETPQLATVRAGL
jgi:hypothetical protein